MLGVGGVGEDAAVDLRVQGGHAVAEDRRVAGDLLGARSTSMPASRMAAAVPPLETRSQPSVGEAAGEIDDPGLVVDGQEGPHAVSSSEQRSRTVGSASTARIVSG